MWMLSPVEHLWQKLVLHGGEPGKPAWGPLEKKSGYRDRGKGTCCLSRAETGAKWGRSGGMEVRPRGVLNDVTISFLIHKTNYAPLDMAGINGCLWISMTVIASECTSFINGTRISWHSSCCISALFFNTISLQLRETRLWRSLWRLKRIGTKDCWVLSKLEWYKTTSLVSSLMLKKEERKKQVWCICIVWL